MAGQQALYETPCTPSTFKARCRARTGDIIDLWNLPVAVLAAEALQPAPANGTSGMALTTGAEAGAAGRQQPAAQGSTAAAAAAAAGAPDQRALVAQLQMRVREVESSGELMDQALLSAEIERMLMQ
jgi:hypothetical protein